jgi:site-specific recombinase XerD
MAGGREYSAYQKKLIDRYYENRDSIMLAKLQELASELFLAESDKKRERLWERVEKAMKQLKVKESIAAHVLAKRDPAILAKNVEDWLKQPPTG